MKRIRVTEEHIKNGARCKTQFCPVALAMKDSGISNAVVRERTFGVNGLLGDCFSRSLPARVTRFVARFDEGKPVAPFEFNLPID